MASKKPVMHARDHLPGGADPIPGMLVEGGGGTPAEAHFTYPSTSLGGSGGSVTIPWSLYDGPAFMNLGITDRVKAVDRAVYAASLQVTIFPPAPEPAGDGVDVYVEAVQLAGPAYATAHAMPSLASFVNPGNSSDVWFATGTLIAILNPNDYLQVGVTNRTTYSVDVVASLSVVRVVAF